MPSEAIVQPKTQSKSITSLTHAGWIPTGLATKQHTPIKDVTINNDKKLNSFLKTDPTIAALPTNAKARADL